MGRCFRWRAAISFLQKRAHWRSVRARATWLALALGACGLLLAALLVSSPVRAAQAASAPAFTLKPSHTPPRPTPHKPTPTATATPSPTPPATVAPSPTPPATAAPNPTQSTTNAPNPTPTPGAATTTTVPNAAPTQTATPSGSADSSGPDHTGHNRPQGVMNLPDWLILTPLAVAVLAFSAYMALEARRKPHKARQQTPASAAQQPDRVWLQQSHQALPHPKAAPPMSEASPPPLPPPRWLIDAGLLPEDVGEPPASGTAAPPT